MGEGLLAGAEMTQKTVSYLTKALRTDDSSQAWGIWNTQCSLEEPGGAQRVEDCPFQMTQWSKPLLGRWSGLRAFFAAQLHSQLFLLILADGPSESVQFQELPETVLSCLPFC